MHVDTHGGYLNLMTHQREVVVAVTPAPGGRATFANIDPVFEEVSLTPQTLAEHPAFRGEWLKFIMNPEVRKTVERSPGNWGHYLAGSLAIVQHRFPDQPVQAPSGVIGSDLPRGAALSSSAAMCLAVIAATLRLNGLALPDDPLILAVRDAEWYTGSRCGLSDPTAMILGRHQEFVNIALYPPRLDTSAARRIPFPDALRILVINSYTERSLSGAARLDFTRNRFAYSLALEILRQEMRRTHVPNALIAKMDRLSNVTPAVLEPIGGEAALFRLLRDIPETASLAELRARYTLPGLEEIYEQHFATVPAAARPQTIGLRGPLLFGIAESERARVFADAIEDAAFLRAGALMSIGHDGDRRIRPDGTPYRYDVSDAALDRVIARRTPIECCPGAYGASAPVLDALVDTALQAGALGASLTGAGMAGTVLALCRAEDTAAIAEAVRQRMASDDYARLANRDTPLSRDELAQATVENTATAGPCEVELE
jgi:galactokinase